MKTLIQNVRIMDGSGAPWYRGSVLVEGDKIKAMGFVTEKADQIFDGEDLILAPGFIDLHTHADHGILEFPLAENYLRQGVTTVIGGNCGGSEFPIAEHLEQVKAQGTGINYGLLVGHGSLRREIMGMEMRHPEDHEQRAMEELLAQSLNEGALGMSMGLYYVPGSFAKTEEVVGLAKVVAQAGGFVSIHMRDESDYNIGLLASIKEALRIAEEAKVPLQISHLKCLGTAVWSKAEEALALLDEARRKGLEVTYDQYPYPASSTSLNGALLPPWAQEGGSEGLAQRLGENIQRQKIKDAVLLNMARRGGATSLVVANSSAYPQYNGLNLKEIALLRHEEVGETILNLIDSGHVQVISFNMQDDDINMIMNHPLGMVASDGSLVALNKGQPHPRYYGTFPRVLSKYVKEGIVHLSEAVRRMTSAPAARLKLLDRGLLRPGMAADLVLFDPEQIKDRAEFGNPHNYPAGIKMVMVNGQIALLEDHIKVTKAGRILF